MLDRLVFTNEHGVFGGLMGTAIGNFFVPALNADAVMDQSKGLQRCIDSFIRALEPSEYRIFQACRV